MQLATKLRQLHACSERGSDVEVFADAAAAAAPIGLL